MKYPYQFFKVVNTRLFLLEGHVSYTDEVRNITSIVDLPLKMF